MFLVCGILGVIDVQQVVARSSASALPCRYSEITGGYPNIELAKLCKTCGIL